MSPRDGLTIMEMRMIRWMCDVSLREGRVNHHGDEDDQVDV